MKEKINICFIGCGRFAKHFVPLFKAHPEVEKVFVCDLIPERAEKYSETFNVPIIESFEKAIKSKEIDECGFTLSTKDKKKHTYKFGDYVSSKSELITKGVNLSKISKDINEKLREYDLAMILSGEILQRKDCDLLDQLIQEE